MPLDFTIDAKQGVVHVTATGEVSLSDDRACLDRVLDDPAFRPGFGFLVDNRERRPAATAEHVRGMAAMFSARQARLGELRLAFVVDRDVSFGMARMFSGLTSDLRMEVEIFRSVDEARAWLVDSRER